MLQMVTLLVRKNMSTKKDWFNSFVKQVKKTLLENKNIIIGGDF